MSSPRDTALDLIAFLDASPSPYHAVAEALRRLTAAGFTELKQAAVWPTDPGRYVVVDGGSLLAWILPEVSPPDAPFRLLGAHTDSPTLRVKPRPDTGQAGLRQLGVEVYGGALLNSWLDRDLGLAGRVVVRAPGGPQVRLIRVHRPLLRVPQLAIHLDPGLRTGRPQAGCPAARGAHLVARRPGARRVQPVPGSRARRPGAGHPESGDCDL